MHLSSKVWENVLFELGSEGIMPVSPKYLGFSFWRSVDFEQELCPSLHRQSTQLVALLQVVQHDNGANVVLQSHQPEICHGRLKRSLSHDEGVTLSVSLGNSSPLLVRLRNTVDVNGQATGSNAQSRVPWAIKMGVIWKENRMKFMKLRKMHGTLAKLPLLRRGTKIKTHG